MKKILFMFFAAVAAVSCALEGGYSQTYQYVGSFEYSDDVYAQHFSSDSTYFDADGKLGVGYGDLSYFHKLDAQGAFLGGFRLSYLKAAGLSEKPDGYVPNELRVAGNPLSKKNTYAVYTVNYDPTQMPEHDIKIPELDYISCTVSYCWVNNTEAVYEAVKENFNPGDKLSLVATGYLDGTPTGTAEITLALKDTTMYSWTKFDLSALGMIDAIDFEVLSSRSDVPKAFCLDELNATIDISY